MKQNLHINIPDVYQTIPAERNVQEYGQYRRLNIATVGDDSPLNLQENVSRGVRKNGIRSRATRGRDTSQESDRLSITGGRALL